MLKKITLLLSLLLVSVLTLSAQENYTEPREFKFGKVGLEEFNMTIEGPDSAADAIKIFDVGNGTFQYSSVSGKVTYVFERHVRYKVVHKKAYDLANLSIYLYNNLDGDGEKLQTISGATYNLEQQKIVVSKMSNDAKFSSRYDKKHVLKRFTLPNVKEGSIIEYTYRTKSDFIFRLNDWEFQGKYPCLYSTIKLTVPQYYGYKMLAGGYTDIKQVKSHQIDDAVFVKANQTQFFANDIPAIKKEDFITTMDDYVTKIGFELRDIRYPDQPAKDFSSTWPKVVKELIEMERFGGYIRKNHYDKQLLADVIKTETDPELKMNLIFNYVKNTIKWDGKYAYSTDDKSSLKTVLEKKQGNSAEVNLLLMALLRDAGLNAAPVLISTRENGKHPGYPLLTQFNNVIVTVENGDNNHLLDATDRNNGDNLISYQNLNHQGLKLDLEAANAEWISTESVKLSKTATSYLLALDSALTLKGSLFLHNSQYYGLNLRDGYQHTANEKEFIKNHISYRAGMEVNNYEIENVDQPGETLSEKMDVVIKDQIEQAADLIYFSPLLFDKVKKNPFTLEERNFPVDFGYPHEENYTISIEYPKNFKLEKLPVSQKFTLASNGGSFTIVYASTDQTVEMTSKITLSKSLYSPEEYEDLKELYKNIVRKHAEQIVFKKISL